MTHSLIYDNLASVCVQEHFSQMNDQLDVKVLRAKERNKPHVSKVSVNTILNITVELIIVFFLPMAMAF